MDDARHAIWIEITATRGSAPRDAGTAMKVTAERTTGTIGGGALEHRAIATARRILAKGGTGHSETIPLGPGLGQCCGGSVSLRYTFTPKPTDAATVSAQAQYSHQAPSCPLWLWGAGHVGRAMVDIADPNAFDITWIDSAAERFPDHVPAHATAIPATDMPLLATRAPRHAHHLIFTYCHEIDLALCAALLKRGAESIGLIGSETKWTRFSKRLIAMGLEPGGITCPIGDKSLGKMPAQIAYGTIASLLAAPKRKVSA
jgi:xanthine dehydrogenase accessory factor